MADLVFRIFLTGNRNPGIYTNCNFVATFWSVFNMVRIQNTGLFVCCISHYYQNCFIIFIHSFGFLIWNQFHPIGKQFRRQIDITAICPQLPEIGKIIRMTPARLHFLSWAPVMINMIHFIIISS